MARTNNLTNFLTDVSSAIKQKTGDNTPIPASDFDTEILSIETGGNYQSKTLNVTQNGNYNLLPDQEFDAMSNVSISVSVSPILQNKTVTQNGSYSADTGYDGLGTVIVNVSGSQINNQDKTVIENGVYTADSGYTGLGTVTVNVPAPIKIFETITEMNEDSSKAIGDLAMVYDEDRFINWDGSEVSSIGIVKNVTLPEQVITTMPTCDLDRYGTTSITLTSTQCAITYRQTFRPATIVYTSEDGIHYTTTSTVTSISSRMGNIAQQGDGTWSNLFGYFMGSTGEAFEGIFKCEEVDDYSRITCVDSSSIVVSGSTITKSAHTIEIGDLLDKIYDKFVEETGYSNQYLQMNIAVLERNNNGEITRVKCRCSASTLHYYYGYMNGNNYLWSYSTGTDISTYDPVTYYDYDLVNDIWTEYTETPTLILTAQSTNYFMAVNVGQHDVFQVYRANATTYRVSNDSYVYKMYYGTGVSSESGETSFPRILVYNYVNTQLSELTASDILPNKIGYGDNGVVIGDGSIYDKLEPVAYLNQLYGENLIKYTSNNSSAYFPANVDTQTPVTAPEEGVKLRWLKSKNTLETNDKLILIPQAIHGYNGYVSWTSSDGQYTVSPVTGGSTTVFTIKNNQTNEEWNWDMGIGTSNTKAYVYGHKFYHEYARIANGVDKWELIIHEYNMDTKTSRVLVDYTISDSFTQTPNSASYNFYIYPDLDFWYVNLTLNKSSSLYSNYIIGGKISIANDSHVIYKMFEATTYSTVTTTFSVNNILWVSTRAGTSGDTITIYKYNLSTYSLLNTYNNTCGYFSYNTNINYHPIAYFDNTYLYAMTNIGHCKINLTAGTYEIYNQSMPIFCDCQNGNYFSYDTMTAGKNTTISIYGNKNLQVTKQYRISRIILYGMGYTTTPFFAYLGEQDGKAQFMDDARPVEGMPYTDGTLLDHNIALTPMGCTDTEMLPLYVLTNGTVSTLDMQNAEVENGVLKEVEENA